MKCNPEPVSGGLVARRRLPVWVRPYLGRVVLPVFVVLVIASACAGKSARQATPSTSKSTATTGLVAATIPPFPHGTKVCDTVSSLAGWPSTVAPGPDAYACIRDAFAAGTPAQMSTITGGGDGGRKTQDGYDSPTRRIVTLRVLGKNEVQVITDLTEGGGTVSTRTCRGFEISSVGFQGTDCS